MSGFVKIANKIGGRKAMQPKVKVDAADWRSGVSQIKTRQVNPGLRVGYSGHVPALCLPSVRQGSRPEGRELSSTYPTQHNIAAPFAAAVSGRAAAPCGRRGYRPDPGRPGTNRSREPGCTLRRTSPTAGGTHQGSTADHRSTDRSDGRSATNRARRPDRRVGYPKHGLPARERRRVKGGERLQRSPVRVQQETAPAHRPLGVGCALARTFHRPRASLRIDSADE